MLFVEKIRKAFEKVAPNSAQRKQDKELFLCAATNTSWGLVRELIGKYPDAVRWRDETGATALHFAVFHKDPKMIHYLLDKGADIEAKDNQGARPLHVAALCEGDYATATLQALIGRGAELDAPNKLGATPLLHAVVRGKPWNARELVIAGADENAPNKTGHTALSAAKEVRREVPALYAAIEDGKKERQRRIDEEHRIVAEDMRQSLIREALNTIGNGLDSDIPVMKPVRLAK